VPACHGNCDCGCNCLRSRSARPLCAMHDRGFRLLHPCIVHFVFPLEQNCACFRFISHTHTHIHTTNSLMLMPIPWASPEFRLPHILPSAGPERRSHGTPDSQNPTPRKERTASMGMQGRKIEIEKDQRKCNVFYWRRYYFPAIHHVTMR
jgi:hypothetical protein